MKKSIYLLFCFFLCIFGINAQSVKYQKGYVKKDGTYFEGHYKTKSNKTNHDNYSTKSNTNPYTGTTGIRAKDYSSDAYNYGSGKQIHTGSRGGQYYRKRLMYRKENRSDLNVDSE